MKKPVARTTTFVLLLLIGLTTALPSHGADDQLHLKRVNLVVADLERALKVYRDILGFKVFEVSNSSPTSYS